MDAKTLEFYQSHAREWAAALPHPYSPTLDAFLDQLAPGARILELGCGDGRDAQRMITRGFAVEPSDGSPEMARLASERIGREVRVMRFEELDAECVYDAVWCYASLLHLEERALAPVLRKIHRALLPGGWHFASFKGGDGGHRDDFGRFYSYIPADRLRSAYEDAAPWASLALSSRHGGSFGGTPTIWHNVTAQV